VVEVKQEGVQITADELRKRKLFVATPMYGGQCFGLYTLGLLQLQKAMAMYQMEFVPHMLFNESLITRARNYCVDAFLRTDCTHLLFIDADIQFQPGHVLDLLAYADPESDKDIVCGIYPKKNISWEKVVEAVNQGKADTNPNLLEHFTGDFVFNFAQAGTYQISEPAEVLESGTGFMMIQRHVFDKFAAAHPELSYKPDHARSIDFDGSREITAFFNDPIDPESKRHLSEDYYFCQQVRKLGCKVWICPWVNLNHLGYYKFIGNLAAIGSIGSTAGADKAKITRT
jgi:hypothetical protein